VGLGKTGKRDGGLGKRGSKKMFFVRRAFPVMGRRKGKKEPTSKEACPVSTSVIRKRGVRSRLMAKKRKLLFTNVQKKTIHQEENCWGTFFPDMTSEVFGKKGKV